MSHVYMRSLAVTFRSISVLVAVITSSDGR